MEDNYLKAYKEVIEILKYVPQESVNKIPQTMIETFKAKMDKNYVFKVDISKNFEEQELLDETKAILANIFRDYWATPYQKEKIEEQEKYDRRKLEEEKSKQYNPDDIFKKKQTENKIVNNYNENLPVKVKNENIYKRIINILKKLFHL